MGASSRTSHAPPHSNFLFVYRASYFSAPTVSLYSTPYLCLIFFFKKPGEVCQGCTELLRYATGRLACYWDFIVYCLVSQDNFLSESDAFASVRPAVTH